MKLGTIQAKGLKGLSQFAGGLTFDFEDVPGGIVSIVGGNGEGKSTFLELPIVAAYGAFPSRPDNALIDSVDGRDAFLDVEVTFEGRGTYRARVNVDGVARKTDAVLTLIRPDGRLEQLNDGKVSTFREAVARELPSLTLVLASAFGAQTKTGSFARLGKKERKDLFAELLGLEQFEDWATTSRGAVTLIERRLDVLRDLLQRLRATTTDEQAAALSGTGNALAADITEAELDQREVRDRIVSLEAEVAALLHRAARYVAAEGEKGAAERRQRDLTSSLQRVTDCLRTLDEDLAAEIDRLDARSIVAVRAHETAIDQLPTPAVLDEQLTAAISAIDAALTGKLQSSQARIDNNRALLDRATAVREADRQRTELRQRRDVRAGELADARRHHQQLVRELGDKVRHAATFAGAQGDLDRARRDSQLIEQVPFGARCVDAKCQFVKSASDAAASIPQLEARIAQHEAAKRDVEAAQASVDLAALAIRTSETADEGDRQAISVLDADADRLSILNAAEARVAELQRQQQTDRDDAEAQRVAARARRQEAEHAAAADREQRHREMASLRQGFIDDKAAAEQRASARRTAWQQEQTALRSTMAGVDATIAEFAALMNANADARLQHMAKDVDLVAARDRAEDLAGRVAQLQEQRTAFEQQRAQFRARQAEAKAIAAAIDALETELTEWTLLSRILGRDGLPVLEIDAAGPGVSALANDLLQACFGTRFTVELITQEPKADGRGFKEVFELKVYDAERDAEPRDLTDLSGGEQVIVDEAIKSAIALHLNQRNVLPIRTCWRDETIGALDPESALRYVAMLRRIRERGGFHHVLFISHNLEAAALADVQLHVGGGRIDVRYPPFPEAA